MFVQWPEYLQLNIIQHISGFSWQVFTEGVIPFLWWKTLQRKA
jgi:hypothetical protein